MGRIGEKVKTSRRNRKFENRFPLAQDKMDRRSSIEVSDPEEAGKARLILWVFTGSYVLLLFPIVVLVVLFGAALPAVDATHEHWLTLLYLALLTYPLIAMVCIPLSWIVFKRQAYRKCVLIAAIPSLNVFLSLLAMLNLF